MGDVNFSVDIKIQGMLLEHPEQVQHIVEKEFRAGLNEAVALVHYETALRTPSNFGILKNSIATEVDGKGLSLAGEIGSPMIYALPVEEGARPHMPPLGPIELWVKRKPLDLNYEGVELTVKQVAFLVARKISATGLEAHWMFHDGLQASLTRINEILNNAQQRIMKAIS